MDQKFGRSSRYLSSCAENREADDLLDGVDGREDLVDHEAFELPMDFGEVLDESGLEAENAALRELLAKANERNHELSHKLRASHVGDNMDALIEAEHQTAKAHDASAVCLLAIQCLAPIKDTIQSGQPIICSESNAHGANLIHLFEEMAQFFEEHHNFRP